MSITPFFLELRSAYQSEIEDLTFDSEGRDVLSRRLADKRKEISFLVQMIEISPEMVAVIFHRGFSFNSPGMMDHLLSLEADEFPEWSRLAEGIELTPWARELTQVVLMEPGGEWFMTVAAGLEYMAGKPEAVSAAQQGHDDSEDDDNVDDGEDGEAGDNRQQGFDADEYGDGSNDEKARKEAGADWLADQGFDRKD